MASMDSRQLVGVERHQGGSLPYQNCLICGKPDADQSGSRTHGTGFWSRHKVQVVLGGPTNRSVLDEELVHINCHPDQPYHYKCLKQWFVRFASCPLDHRLVHIVSPSTKSPAVDCLDDRQSRVHNLGLEHMFQTEKSIISQKFPATESPALDRLEDR